MGEFSVSMKALAAVAPNIDYAVLLQVWPEDTGPDTPWGCEFEAAGVSYCLDEVGLSSPGKPGIWVWEGQVYYPGPNYEGICDDGPTWVGSWRLATLQELSDFLQASGAPTSAETAEGIK